MFYSHFIKQAGDRFRTFYSLGQNSLVTSKNISQVSELLTQRSVYWKEANYIFKISSLIEECVWFLFEDCNISHLVDPSFTICECE